MASDPNTISLRVEDVRAELAKIMREAQEMPGASQVSHVVGASSGSAADFSARVRAALGRAAQSATALMRHLDDLDAQARGAVEALSGEDMSAETTLSALGGTMPTPTSRAKNSTASAAKRGFV